VSASKCSAKLDTCSVHAETAENPITRCDCVNKSVRYRIGPHELHYVKPAGSVRLREDHVCLALQVAVEALEEILEQ
jgi:hypothetical protein